MKEKFLSKISKKCKNQGSGIVLVIVAIAFIGILVGSLLTAVGYAYRLKLYDYNAKDNFYYLEQAMDELYTGVGNDTLTRMQESYTTVITGMNSFSEESGTLVSADSDEMNERFKNTFMYSVATSGDLQKLTIGDYLRSFISNTDVVLASTPTVVCLGADGTVYNWGEGISQSTVIESIVIKDVALSRISNYKRSTANGAYEQTISADIEIARPDFEMEFSSMDLNYSALFDFAMVADNGIEIHTPVGNELGISGNIYAAADFYDKEYNYSNALGKSGYSVGSDANNYHSGYISTGGSAGTEDDAILGSS